MAGTAGEPQLADKHDARNLVNELQRQNSSLQLTLARNEAAIASLPAAQNGSAPATASGQNSDLKHLLAELVAQNGMLRDQIAETNRELMTLQFQVDTHSDQFRPLNVKEYDEPSSINGFEADAIGVLPPLDLP